MDLNSDLIFPWMPILWIVVAVIAGVVFLIVRRGRNTRTGRAVANVGRVTELPAYRAAMNRYRVMLAVFAASALLLLIAAVTLASRPAATTVVSPEQGNRDIVLCLDVSGSMVDYDAELVDVFGDLAQQFDGERLGLVVFNASAVTYFPLTSDYGYVREQLDEIGRQFGSDDASYFAGTFFGDGSSLVGDGLAACSQRFDSEGENRSRSIILATDNLVIGNPIFSLQEAGELATEGGVRVYGLNPGDRGSKEYLDEYAGEFEDVVTATGGTYYPLDDPDAVPAIVERISSEQAEISRGAPQLIETDRPELPLVLAFVALAALLGLAWRLQR